MIIKMTVDDNDFSEILEKFGRNLSMNVLKCPDNIEELDSSIQISILKEIRLIDRLFNPNVTEDHTEEEIQLIKKRVKDTFTLFIHKRVSEDTERYLLDNFQVDVVKSMEDKWENGEIFWSMYLPVMKNDKERKYLYGKI